MKNREFFYLQYDKIDWRNQEKTKINSSIDDFIIENFLLKKKGDKIKIFDMGFGIGSFLQTLADVLPKYFSNVILEGCEPSNRNYEYSKIKLSKIKAVELRTFNKTFLNTQTDLKFDFVTSVYVFPHFGFDVLEEIAKKVYSMLNEKGKFVLVVANEKYLKEKLKMKRHLFIEKNIIEFSGKRYREILHYSEIPQIGTVIDYNWEEGFYVDLFKENGFDLVKKTSLDEKGHVCTIFVFSKNKS